MKQNSPELRTAVRNFSLQLSATPRGARLARLLATEQLRSWGLPLVDALADRWGVARGLPPRKTVWAELDLAPEPESACSGGTGAFLPPRTTRLNPHLPEGR